MSKRNPRPVLQSLVLMIALAATLLALGGGTTQPALGSVEQGGAAASAAPVLPDNALPGPDHKRLTDLAGTWDETYDYTNHTGATPVHWTATATKGPILGGRYLRVESKGELGWESQETFGYDRLNNQHTWIEMDSWGTYFLTAAGQYNAAKQSLIMNGKIRDPQTNGKTETYQVVVHYVSPDRTETEVTWRGGVRTGVLKIVATRHK